MKAKLFMTAVILISLMGCRTYTKAEWDAGQVYQDKNAELVCRHRVAIVAKSMIQRNEKFDLVYGLAWDGKSRHVWIEQYLDGDVYLIEPTWGYDPTHRWTECERVGYPENQATVIATVNGWLKEAKLPPIGVWE